MNVDVSHIFAILVPQYSDCAVEYPVLKDMMDYLDAEGFEVIGYRINDVDLQAMFRCMITFRL